MDLSVLLPLKPALWGHRNLDTAASHIVEAKNKGSSVILMMGAHVLRSGVQRYLIDLMEKGFISCVAMNGASIVHDYELARIGKTTESVAEYIKSGKFGLWRETGEINDIVNSAAKRKMGLGEAVGKSILNSDFPNKAISLFASGYRSRIPMTVHVGIGYDIVHQHPNCSGAAYGETSYIDFLRFTKELDNIENGVVMNFGSSVMAPEVFLKALSMVRNVAAQEHRSLNHFTTLVCDLYPLPENYQTEASKEHHHYYFRPWKTMLVRTVADGGQGLYVRGRHAETIPALWTAIQNHQ